MKIYLLFYGIFTLAKITFADEEPFELSIIHINDFHARFQPTSISSGPCKESQNKEGRCYGGIARIVTAIRDLQDTLPNPVVLNAGDNFQGTLLYSLFKWNITLQFMNHIPFDATALGNHEFDNGVDGLVPFISGLKYPVVAVNMNVTEEPQLKDIVKPSIVIERGGRKIGIIGCITKYTYELSSSGKVHFLDEIAPVTAEASRLRKEGVDIIVLLSHSGYNVDQKIARQVADIDIIVGAHTHSLLYTGTPPSTEEVAGEYPTVVTQKSGHRVLIVQAYAYTKYVGVLNLKFDSTGEVTSWSGNPKLMDNSIEENAEIKAQLEPWVEEANVQGEQTIGSSAVLLDSSNCYKAECNLGNLLTDAMVHENVDIEVAGQWTSAAIAIMNPGAFRAPIGENPNITYNDLVTSQPFQNTIDTIELQGKDIVAILELSASGKPRSYKDFSKGKGCMQVSGIQASYNMSKPEGSRLTEVLLRCTQCRIPKFIPVEYEEWYNVAMPSYLSNGGSGFKFITERGRNKIIGPLDTDVFTNYIEKESPIIQGIEGRIRILE